MGAFARFAGAGPQDNRGGDPLADAAVARVLDGSDPTPANLVEAVLERAAAGDAACEAFVRQVVSQPGWVEPARIELGRRVSLSLAPPIGAVLLLGGLPEVYAVPAIARALSTTGRLKNLTWLRILETGRFVRDVHGEDALAPLGIGGRAIAQVRLVHALVRHRVAQRGGPTVITQAQLAFVLCAHSHVVRRGLATLGMALSEREAAAHQHLWRLIGHRMGIEAGGLAASPAQESRLYAGLWLRMVDGTDPACRELAHVGIETAARQARVPVGLARAIAARLVRPTLAARLQLSGGPRWGRVLDRSVAVVRTVHGLRRVVPGASRIAARIGTAIADAIVERDPSRAEPVGVAAARGALEEGSR